MIRLNDVRVTLWRTQGVADYVREGGKRSVFKMIPHLKILFIEMLTEIVIMINDI